MCVEQCPEQALTMEGGKVVWNESKCVQCDTCIHVCPHNASPKIHQFSVEELYEEISQYFPYIQGITVSGGECSEYPLFLKELFELVHKDNKTCFMDSNGSYLYEDMSDLMKEVDAVMLDVKAIDPKHHKWLTGIDNEVVLKNLEYLQKNHLLYEVRTVCLPNASEINETTVRGVVSRLDPNIRYKLIKYRPFGVREEGLKELGNVITSDDEINRLKDIAESLGHKNIIIV